MVALVPSSGNSFDTAENDCTNPHAEDASLRRLVRHLLVPHTWFGEASFACEGIYVRLFQEEIRRETLAPLQTI